MPLHLNDIHNSETYKQYLIEQAENALAAAEGFVTKCEAHLDGARESVAIAEDDLAHIKAEDVVWEAPQEHVIAGVDNSAKATP